MSQQEKTISELTAECWTKEFNNLINETIKETGKTREEVIKDIMMNRLIATPIERDLYEQTTKS